MLAWGGEGLAKVLEAVAAGLTSAEAEKRGAELFEGNYAPVEGDVFVGGNELETTGTVPEGLEGWFLRTGPNQVFKPNAGYHLFDGDGMCHAVRLSASEGPTYQRHQIETVKLLEEKKRQRGLFPKIGEMSGWSGLLRMLAFELRVKSGGCKRGSTANTALVEHAGRLLALNESDIPYELTFSASGRLGTAGPIALPLMTPFTAHPKVDPETGRLHAFGYQMQKPFLKYYELDERGTPTLTLGIDLPAPIMMHDFAITANHVIFLDLSLAFKGEAMLQGDGKLPFVFDTNKEARIGVMRKGETDPTRVKWLKTEPHMVFHIMNAWEESASRICLVACRIDRFDLSLDSLKRDLADDERNKLCKYTLDLAAESVVCETILDDPPRALDFPVVAPQSVGRPTRFGFICAFEPHKPVAVRGVHKVDMASSSGSAGFIDFGADRLGGECIFVPRTKGAPLRGDDDGFLLTILFDEASQRSEFCVFDAYTMSPTPLYSVRIPSRVPFGFHALFVPAGRLAASPSKPSRL